MEALNGPQCAAIHITEIEKSIECDTFIPCIDFSIFRPWYSSPSLAENNIRHSFVSYVRVRSSTTEAHDSRSEDYSKFKVEKFTFLPKMIFERHDEYVYLKLVQEIISSGTPRDDRTGTGTLSKFGCQVE